MTKIVRIESGTLAQRLRMKGVRLDRRQRDRIIGYTRPFFEVRFQRYKGMKYDSSGIASWFPRGENHPSIPVRIDPSATHSRLSKATALLFPENFAESLLAFIKKEQANARAMREDFWSKGNSLGRWFEYLLFPEFVPGWPAADHIRLLDKDIIDITVTQFDRMEIPADPYGVKKALQRWKKKVAR